MVPLGSEAERICDPNLVALCPQRPPNAVFSVVLFCFVPLQILDSTIRLHPAVSSQAFFLPNSNHFVFFLNTWGRDGLFILKQGSAATITVFFYRIQLNKCNKWL